MKVLGVCAVLAVVFLNTLCAESASVITVNNRNVTSQRISKRLFNLPALGIGHHCNGCPAHFCDDDEAVIYGYCCGCARLFDILPVKCSARIVCPPNGYSLCDDYEYMLHCCC